MPMVMPSLAIWRQLITASAAELLFGPADVGDEYALSSNIFQASQVYQVNHQAWYDRYNLGAQELAESWLADANGDGFYNAFGDVSAYVSDRAVPGENINHVFRTASLPAPATLVIFVFSLIALTAHRFRSSKTLI